MGSWKNRLLLLTISLISIIFIGINNGFSALVQEKSLLEYGIEQYKQENFEEALEIFKKLYQKNPESSVVNYYLGLCYKEVGDYKKALEYFKNAVRFKPVIKEAYIEIAYILYNLNKTEKALNYLRLAEKEKVNLKVVYYLESKIFMQQGRYKEARKVFKKLEKVAPERYLEIELQIGISYLREEDFKKAEQVFKHIIKKAPDSKEAKVARVVLSELKNFQKNWKYFSGLISIGSIYDTNVVAKPSETIGLTAVDDISKKSDFSAATSISLNYNSFPKKRMRYVAGLTFNNQYHFSITSYSFISLGAHFDTIMNSNLYPIFGGLRFLGNYYWLDKEKYMGEIGINPFVNIKVSEDTILKLSLGINKRDILKYPVGAVPEDDRDGYVYGLKTDLKRKMSSRFYLTAGIGAQRQDTEGSNWDANVFSGRLKGDYFLAENIFLSGSTEYKIIRFTNVNTYSGKGIPGFPSNPEKRKDDVFTFNIGLNARFKHCILQVFNTYLINSSNFKIYDYKRDIVGVMIGYAF